MHAYDIVLKPSVAVSETAIQVSKQLAIHPNFFTLSPTGPYAHVSLYMLQFADTNLDNCLTMLGDIARQQHDLTLRPKQYHQSRGYIDIEYEATDALRRLQILIVNSLQSVRNGIPDIDRENARLATGVQQDNFQQYGYAAVDSLFRPHLTFTRFRDVDPITTNNLPLVETFTCTSSQLALHRLGEHGTCFDEVAVLSFG